MWLQPWWSAELGLRRWRCSSSCSDGRSPSSADTGTGLGRQWRFLGADLGALLMSSRGSLEVQEDICGGRQGCSSSATTPCGASGGYSLRLPELPLLRSGRRGHRSGQDVRFGWKRGSSAPFRSGASVCCIDGRGKVSDAGAAVLVVGAGMLVGGARGSGTFE